MSTSSSFKSEAEFVSWIRKQTPTRAAGLTLGIGDDAALLTVPRGKELILTTDLSIEDVHFTSALHPPRAVGHRALARSLSDIAAMGGTPRYALLSLAFSQSINRPWLEGFFDGFFALARRFSVAVIGGDTALGPGALTADVIVAGVVPHGQALRRSGARPGNRIFVSGRLGMSALGLRLLPSREGRLDITPRTAEHAHLFPEPQCALGQFLAKHRLASATMDISDGLSTDLQRLCEASGVGATLFATRLPAPTGLEQPDALSLALHGGEDYQLLFTVPKSKAAKIPSRFGKIPLTWIGDIDSQRGVRVVNPDGRTEPVEAQGYDHFKQ